MYVVAQKKKGYGLCESKAMDRIDVWILFGLIPASSLAIIIFAYLLIG
jgi:hypothetical protein